MVLLQFSGAKNTYKKSKLLNKAFRISTTFFITLVICTNYLIKSTKPIYGYNLTRFN